MWQKKYVWIHSSDKRVGKKYQCSRGQRVSAVQVKPDSADLKRRSSDWC